MNQLKHIKGRVICAIDLEGKNSHRFASGATIRLERQWNNLDKIHTEPVNGTVIDAENIPVGAEILVHHNSTHPTYKINNFTPTSGEEIASSIKYFSIPVEDCYIWREPHGEWQPMEGFATALRVFKPYKGILQGIEPTLIKNVLYLTSGEYKGFVCHTVRAADYPIKFQDNGRENIVIRCRPHGDKKTKREREVIAINWDYTHKVNIFELWVGITVSDAKSIIQFERANTL